MEYKEENYLSLSGIQHFAFCRRQWGLIHIERIWEENLLTAEGRLLHDNAHDPYKSESRGEVIISRAIPVFSRTLGICGECDIVEFQKSTYGIQLPKKSGRYEVYPVEYKRGKPKNDNADILQLTAQAMCLEEMFATEINSGAVFYATTRRRLSVDFTEELKSQVKKIFIEMHYSMTNGCVAKAKFTKSCSACSLAEFCMPRLSRLMPASVYNKGLGEDE